LSPDQALGIAAAGAAAGAVNTVVGSGSLITFPTLLAFGYAPVTANVSNNVGLVFGSISGALGYRRELSGQRKRIIRLGIGSVLGGALGAVLLIVLPAQTFVIIVPVFVALAVIGVLIQPRLSVWISRRHEEASPHGGAPAVLTAGVAGIYGGYFGAAQGIMLLAVLGLLLDEELQRLNALKNVLTGLVNGCAAVVFIAAAHVDWPAAGLIAGGSLIGGQIGARYGRRLPPAALRGLVAVVGAVAIVQLLT
jgi:hypothetical protein